MRLASIALALTSILLLTACANSNKDVPATPATSIPSATVTFCPDLRGSVPIADGVCAVTSMPSAIPSGATQLGDFYEFQFDHSPAKLVLTLPLHISSSDPVVYMTLPPGTQPYWYTHSSDGWHRISTATIQTGSSELLVTHTFNGLPPNLIVLAVPDD